MRILKYISAAEVFDADDRNIHQIEFLLICIAMSQNFSEHKRAGVRKARKYFAKVILKALSTCFHEFSSCLPNDD